MKKEPAERENTFASHISDDGLASRLYEEFLKINSEKITPFKKGQ